MSELTDAMLNHIHNHIKNNQHMRNKANIPPWALYTTNAFCRVRKLNKPGNQSPENGRMATIYCENPKEDHEILAVIRNEYNAQPTIELTHNIQNPNTTIDEFVDTVMTILYQE